MAVRCQMQIAAHRHCTQEGCMLQGAANPSRRSKLDQHQPVQRILGKFHPDPFITKFLKDDQHYLTIFSVEKINVLVTILVLR